MPWLISNPNPNWEYIHKMGQLPPAQHETGTLRVSVDWSEYLRFPKSALAELILDQPDLRLRSKSVYDGGDSENSLATICKTASILDKGVARLCDGMDLRSGTARKYVRVYDVDPYSSPSRMMSFRQPFLMPITTTHTLSEDSLEEVKPIAVIDVDCGLFTAKHIGLLLYYSGKREIQNVFDYSLWPTTFNTTNAYRPCLSYVEKYDTDFDEAAKLLHASHPELHLDNVRIWIRQHFIHELRNLDSIDVWQDISACHEIGCEYEDKFKATFPDMAESNSLYVAWKMASTLRNNRANQGYGPGQIILEQAMEAASDDDIAMKYAAHIPRKAFKDQDAMLKAILDPKRSIFVKAMIYDFILARMKETVFRSKEVRFSSDVYPFIGSDATSREMALINGAQILSMYPERAHKLRSYTYSGPDLQMFGNFCAFSKMLGIEPCLPGVVCEERGIEELSYTSKDLGKGEMDGKIKAHMPWTAHFMRPGWKFEDTIRDIAELFNDIFMN